MAGIDARLAAAADALLQLQVGDHREVDVLDRCAGDAFGERAEQAGGGDPAAVGAARVGYLNGDYVLNPTKTQLETSQMDLVVAGTQRAVLMVESEAQQLPEAVMLGAVEPWVLALAL